MACLEEETRVSSKTLWFQVKQCVVLKSNEIGEYQFGIKSQGYDVDLLNLTFKNLAEQVAYLAEQLAKNAQERAEIKTSLQATNARIEATNKRIKGVVTTVETTPLRNGFVRKPQPTNDDYDDTSLKWYVPEFSRAGDSKDFLEWVDHMDYFFDYKGFDDQKSYKIANMKLRKCASLWFDTLKAKIMKESAHRIKTWTEMKR
ncbi:hypothetical protein POM88_051188 [Heracleum sosnowskyi]|uniref:Retrotransposon gag domain-containing protein n=1 Tax=Heracleum sosnowskyi TaxID=360622 RepID=A0AAD8M381_9APIA|nr:hypothetical protein POM88_051188 [Heracleum sosnowskyi]